MCSGVESSDRASALHINRTWFYLLCNVCKALMILSLCLSESFCLGLKCLYHCGQAIVFSFTGYKMHAMSPKCIWMTQQLSLWGTQRWFPFSSQTIGYYKKLVEYEEYAAEYESRVKCSRGDLKDFLTPSAFTGCKKKSKKSWKRHTSHNTPCGKLFAWNLLIYRYCFSFMHIHIKFLFYFD